MFTNKYDVTQVVLMCIMGPMDVFCVYVGIPFGAGAGPRHCRLDASLHEGPRTSLLFAPVSCVCLYVVPGLRNLCLQHYCAHYLFALCAFPPLIQWLCHTKYSKQLGTNDLGKDRWHRKRLMIPTSLFNLPYRHPFPPRQSKHIGSWIYSDSHSAVELFAFMCVYPLIIRGSASHRGSHTRTQVAWSKSHLDVGG